MPGRSPAAMRARESALARCPSGEADQKEGTWIFCKGTYGGLWEIGYCGILIYNDIYIYIHIPSHNWILWDIDTHIHIHIRTHIHTCNRQTDIYPSIHPSTHPSTHPSIHPSIHPSVHPCMHACMQYKYMNIKSLCTYIHTYKYILKKHLRTCTHINKYYVCGGNLTIITRKWKSKTSGDMNTTQKKKCLVRWNGRSLARFNYQGSQQHG